MFRDLMISLAAALIAAILITVAASTTDAQYPVIREGDYVYDAHTGNYYYIGPRTFDPRLDERARRLRYRAVEPDDVQAYRDSLLWHQRLYNPYRYRPFYEGRQFRSEVPAYERGRLDWR